MKRSIIAITISLRSGIMRNVRNRFLIVSTLVLILTLVSGAASAIVLNKKAKSTYAIRDNKLFINPGNDTRFLSGVMSFDLAWFDAIKYFNHNGYDVDATTLCMDYDIPSMMVYKSGNASNRLAQDTIWFYENNGSKNRRNPFLLLSGFSIYTSELEVCGMRVGETKRKIAGFLGLPVKLIKDTIIVVNPNRVYPKSNWDFLLIDSKEKNFDKIIEGWHTMAEDDIKIVFDNDTIKSFNLY